MDKIEIKSRRDGKVLFEGKYDSLKLAVEAAVSKKVDLSFASLDGALLDRIYQGDALKVLRTWPDGFVQTVCTSPPYWALRDYGVAGQIGLERTPEEYIEKMVAVFREVRRVLRDDGTLWLNMGDTAVASGGHTKMGGSSVRLNRSNVPEQMKMKGVRPSGGLKPKDIVGMPWMLAFALRADGWILRQDIIWAKTNPMPESVRDRCTKAHEYLFLLSKSPRYYYDAEAIKEPVAGTAHGRGHGVNPKCAGWANGKGSHAAIDHAKSKKDAGRSDQGLKDSSKFGRGAGWRVKQNESFAAACNGMVERRNKRSVWTINPEPCKDAHFATFPTKLVEPCILAGTAGGGIVLDPFMGSGTVALVAARLNRHFLGIELNPAYIQIAERRIAGEVAQGKIL